MSKTGYLIIILSLFCCSSLLAQSSPPNWGGGADQNDLSFGFSFSYVSTNYKIVKKPNWRDPYYDPGVNNYITSPLTSISSPKSQGFGIGFITRYRISDHLEVRTNPALIFADRSLAYTYEDASENVTKQVQPTTIDVPLSFKLKSDRVGNFRAYILGGVKYSQAVGKGGQSDANVDPIDKLVKNVRGFASYDAGLGCDIYFEFFKLSPEIKLSNSFGNVLVPEDQPFSSPISKLSLHSVMFSLIFE